MFKLRTLGLFAGATLFASSLQAQDYKVEYLPINSPESDFSPMYFDGGIVFSSNRSKRGLDWDAEAERQYYTDLFFTRPDENGNYSEPVLFSKDITDVLNEGPAVFDRTSQVLYYTANVAPTEASKRKRDKVDEYKLGIFSAERSADGWMNIQGFPYNDLTGEYNLAHPALSLDGRILVFTSNMPGGYGGPDLYRCERDAQGNWSAPVNLGAEINTEGPEMFPFIDRDGQLYFSSNIQPGAEGMDVFVCSYDNGIWRKPYRLPAPLNSAADDFGFILHPNGMEGYVSSNRKDSIDNLFSYRFQTPAFVECLPSEKPKLHYRFSTDELLDMSQSLFEFQWDFGDGQVANGREIEHVYASEGDYTVSLKVVDPADQQVFIKLAEMEAKIERIDRPYIRVIDAVAAQENVDLSALESDISAFEVEEWVWDLGDGAVFRGPELSHKYQTAGTKTVKLMALGKADAAGNRPSVSAYKKITVYAQGETLPEGKDEQQWVHKHLAHAWSDLAYEEGAQQYHLIFAKSEKRLAFNDQVFAGINQEISELSIPAFHYVYALDAGQSFSKVYEVFRSLHAGNYHDLDLYVSSIEESDDLVLKQGGKIENGNDAQLNNAFQDLTDIKFALDSDAIKEESFVLLDDLASILENESGFHLEIMAHTCNMGASEYNLDLSRRRAVSVVQYLQDKGVPEARMQACGFGDIQPVASNANEHGRAKNRRVEFAIIFDLPEEDRVGVNAAEWPNP